MGPLDSVESSSRKGILLAGGHGTRLQPLTIAVNKQLLPVFDKPLVYYPLATLMLAGVRKVLLITTGDAKPLFERLFGDGSHLGLSLEYAVQPRSRGIADAILIGESFIAAEPVALVLGDNLFFGERLPALLKRCAAADRGATVLTCPVSEPSRYGILTSDRFGKPQSIVEKPAHGPLQSGYYGALFL